MIKIGKVAEAAKIADSEFLAEAAKVRSGRKVLFYFLLLGFWISDLEICPDVRKPRKLA